MGSLGQRTAKTKKTTLFDPLGSMGRIVAVLALQLSAVSSMCCEWQGEFSDDIVRAVQVQNAEKTTKVERAPSGFIGFNGQPLSHTSATRLACVSEPPLHLLQRGGIKEAQSAEP